MTASFDYLFGGRKVQQNKKILRTPLGVLYVLTVDPNNLNKVIKVFKPQYGVVNSPHELRLIAAAGYDINIPEVQIRETSPSKGTRNAALLRLLTGEKKDAGLVEFEKTFISGSCKTTAVKVL